MAIDTHASLRSQVMYCVFVRNYSPEGTFDAVRRDLPRIRALGVDVIWLMPIHPIGESKRKGTLGSPYAIRDYRAVNPEFGALADFIALTEAIHALGMRVIIDVVYNHTSPDSVLAQAHPEWFYHRPDGSFGNRIGDWSDIIDLDYGQPALWDYQIETLEYWAQWVDGFRCDVAPLVPLAFWLRAREAVARVRPDCLWLAESVEPGFIAHVRSRGMTGLSDSEIFRAFDVCYDYDVYPDFLRVATGESGLRDYAAALNRQETAYPDNYVKLRFLENHDRPRTAQLFPDARARRNWTAFQFFQKGMPLVYNGQEAGCAHRPGLFDRETIDWRAGADISGQIARLAALKKHPLMTVGSWSARDMGGGRLMAQFERDGRRLVGLFWLGESLAPMDAGLADGMYENLAGGNTVHCECGLIAGGEPVIVEA